MVGLDVARLRGLYPTLAAGTAQLDGGFATLQPESVIRSIVATLRAAPAQPGSASLRSQGSATRALRARRALADLTGARTEDIVLGPSGESLLDHFAQLVSRHWQLGDEIVLNRLDADAVLHPWQRAAAGSGVVSRWAEVDLDTGELPGWQYEELVGRRTRLVTVPLANPATGTVPDVAAIAAFAHRHGALVALDAGSAPNYLPLSLGDLGADLVTLAAPAFGGPSVAALVTRPGLLEEIAGDDPGRIGLPLPVELLDGVTAAIEHLADIAGPEQRHGGPRRERLVDAVGAGGEYALGLYRRLDSELRELPRVTVLGGPDRALPLAAFTVAGLAPDVVGASLARRGVAVWSGPSGTTEVLRAFGADELGGAVFVGLMPYTTPAEVGQLVDALRDLTR